MHWDANQGILSGIGLGAPGLSWTLTVYVPEDFTWSANQREIPGVAGIFYENNLLQARLNFEETDRVAWSFAFDAVGAHR